MKAPSNYVLHRFRILSVMITFIQFNPGLATNTDCADQTIGVENRYIIPDRRFSTNSFYDSRYVASNGRLNGYNGWGPGSNWQSGTYLQIDLGYPHIICAVATQGRSSGREWVTEYKISMSLDNSNWTAYQENGQIKKFVGNRNYDTVKKNPLTKPLVRYIKFIPTKYRTWKTMRVGIYGYLKACENFPLGMESGAIQDGRITASSAQYPAKNARLYYTSGSSWCASTSDSSPYLQIDLGSSHLICAVATQGNSITDKWVKTYQINTSSDGTTWTTYQENNSDRTFYGNYDRTTVVRRLLYHGVITRYLRIVPKTYQGGTLCLRTEIYGYPFQPACSSHSIGIPNSSLVPDHRFTATSEAGHNCCNPYKGRLGANPGWLPKTDTADDYLQVDLGDVFYICAVATQGHGGNWNEWVTRYKILYSTNNKAWTTYSDESGNEHEFNGNSDRTTVVTNSITNPFRAKFVRVFPTAYHRRKMIRIDFKGLPSGCTSSLGIENSQISDSQMTSSSSSDSSHTASRGRLYGSSSWCSSTSSNTEYIQVDLGQTKTVTGIATQGDKTVDKWTTTYKVSYSFDNRDWNEYKDGQVAKVFSGNSNKNDVIVNWFNRPVAARYVRILPQTSSGGQCLRFDLYGCEVFVTPKVIIDTAQAILPAIKGTSTTLSCSVLGEPTPDIQWFNNGTKINGATQPTLQIQFISAEDVLSKSNCTRQDPSTRAVVCNTFYTCRATYPNYVPSGGMDEVTGKVTVNLNVPEPPIFTGVAHQRSITLSWTISTASDDVGQVTWYTIRFQNRTWNRYLYVSHSSSSYELTYLKPYTNYTIKMNTISAVGRGLWSSLQTIQTAVAKPEGAPVITGLIVKSSQSIQVKWQFTAQDKLNGPFAGYTIKYTPDGGATSTTRVQGDVTTVILDSLDKYTVYSITVLVRNTQYDGPESTAMTTRTKEDAPSCSPTLQTAKATTSTSILITWTSLAKYKCLNGILRYYKISYRKTSGGSPKSFYVDKAVLSKEVSSLDKYTTYEFEVRAHTITAGPPSNALQATTLQDAPSEPLNPGANLLHPNDKIIVPRIRIYWQKPLQENGVIKRYSIFYEYSRDPSTQTIINITNVSSLSYTMDVLGENTIRFKISAWTIKEGPYTSFRYGDIPAYPPAVAPKDTQSTKINETTFRVAWQPLPRDQSNGVITKYEVTWQLMHIGNRRRRRSVGQSVTAITQDTQYTIYNLRLCAQYTVYVKGFTKAGAGPNSTVVIVTSRPGEPLNLRPSGKEKTNIDLKWDKPYGVSREIKSYKIIMNGFKPYWKDFSNVSKIFVQSGEKTSRGVQNLQPGTTYEFWVISITECGESNKSVSTLVDTDIDAPVQPKGKPIQLQDKFNVTLWPVNPENGPISSYQVIVISEESIDTNTLPDVIHNYKESKEKNQEYYITAELKASSLKSLRNEFPVGDNKKYGRYQNIALKKGRTYTIAERAVTIHNKKIYTGKAAKIATIQLSAVQTKGDESVQSNPVTGPALGGVFGFCLVLACVLIGIAFYRRYGSKNDSHESSMALDNMEDNDRVSRGSIGTTDSKEASKKYVNEVDTGEPQDDIYDQTIDNPTKPIPVRQFAEYVKSIKATDYARLKEEFKKLPNAQLFSTSVARKPENKKKNRYGNIVTYNHSRVIIECSGEDVNSEYINASYINGFDGTPKVYIASQGPLTLTFPDFWQMIWEQNTCTIVMLTNLKEGSKIKCHQYWPETKETYRDITVNNHKTEVFPDYIIRTLLLTKANSEEQRKVQHFQFTVWPDKGVPHYATAVLGLRRKVKAMNPQNAGPVVVHCSAGVGRTGAYIVIDAMLDRAKKLRNVEISNYVAMIRKARPYMVQTDEQYVFVHLAVLEVLTCGNTEIQVHNLINFINKQSAIKPPKQVSGFTTEFERLNAVTTDHADDECDVGRSKENESKNRYPDVIALNSSRVLLTTEDDADEHINYINASFVHAYRERNAFILTQAPLQNTVEDFWIMVAKYDIRTIVMLNTLQESDEEFLQYWPQTGAQTYGQVTVELLGTQDIGELVSRRLKVTYESSSISVQHLQHLKWPDKSIPANPQTVLDLLNEVEQSQRQSNNTTPVVVQCSNGVGRSGTFCAISSILDRMKQEQVIDVFQVVKCIRSNRPGAVESLTQYIFCYQIIQNYLDSFSDYANFSNR